MHITKALLIVFLIGTGFATLPMRAYQETWKNNMYIGLGAAFISFFFWKFWFKQHSSQEITDTLHNAEVALKNNHDTKMCMDKLSRLTVQDARSFTDEQRKQVVRIFYQLGNNERMIIEQDPSGICRRNDLNNRLVAK